MAKYPWGDNALDDRVMMASMIYTGVLLSVMLQVVIPGEGVPAINSGMALHPTFTKKGEPVSRRWRGWHHHCNAGVDLGILEWYGNPGIHAHEPQEPRRGRDLLHWSHRGKHP